MLKKLLKVKRKVAVNLLIVLAVLLGLATAGVFIFLTSADRRIIFSKPQKVEFEGKTRLYRTVVPKKINTKTSIIIGLHGLGGSGRQFAYFTGLHNAAKNSVVIYPETIDPTKPTIRRGWNAEFCCGSGWVSQTNDAGFIVSLIDQAAKKYNISKERVFLAGFSNGAFLAQSIVAKYPDKIGGIAVSAGTIGTEKTKLQLNKPVAALLMHGKQDALVPFDGGAAPGNPDFAWLSFESTVKDWKKANSCMEKDILLSGRHHYKDCKKPLVTIVYENNGHKWDDWRILNFWHKIPNASKEAVNFFSSL